jgi:hypothetical protein
MEGGDPALIYLLARYNCPLFLRKSFSPIVCKLRLRISVMESTGWQAYERAHLRQEGLRGKIRPLKTPCDQAQLDVDPAKMLASVFVQACL